MLYFACFILEENFMSIKGVDKTNNEVKYEAPKPKVEPKSIKFEQHTQQGKASILGANNFTGNALKHKLNALANTATAAKATLVNNPEADKKAEEILNANGGGKDEGKANKVGKDIAEIAKTNPELATAVMSRVQETLKDTTFGDNVASGFVNNLSDAELKKVAGSKDAKPVLQDLQNRLLSGNVHDNERAEAVKIDFAVKGYNPPNLVGNPEKDVQTIANDLKNIPADKRDEYLNEVLQHPAGKEALQRSGLLSEDDRKILAGTISEAYKQNPSEIGRQINSILDMDKQFPISEWQGFADVIAKTGNDNLIAGFAKHAMEIAKKSPETSSWSVDAVTALSGMSPEGLGNFINFGSAKPPQYGSPSQMGAFIEANKKAFFDNLNTAAGFLGMKANNSGFANPWAFSPAMGDLINKASQMKGADGKLSPDALNIFKTISAKTGDNFFTKEALGKMFIENPQQIADTFASPTLPDGHSNPNYDPNVLKDFFAGVVYSPISDLLKYNGKSLTEAIMGKGGSLEKITDTIMERAKTAKDPTYLGRELGSLFGAVSAGFLDSVQNYKDKFAEDKEFRDFAFGLLSKGLGKLAAKVGIPLDKIGDFAQKMFEASKEKDKAKQLALFKEQFINLGSEISAKLIDFQKDNNVSSDFESGFTLGWTNFITKYLATDKI